MKPLHRTAVQALSIARQPERGQMHYRFHGATPESPPAPVSWKETQPFRARRRSNRMEGSTVQVLLTLRHLDAETLKPLDRGARYRRLLAHAAAQRQCIAQWLEEHHLSAEVASLGDPNTFNLLFVTCTPRVAEMLKEAPGVVDVAIDGAEQPR